MRTRDARQRFRSGVNWKKGIRCCVCRLCIAGIVCRCSVCRLCIAGIVCCCSVCSLCIVCCRIISSIDPALNSAVDGGNMLLHSYECLLTVDQEGKLAPGQAESWETSEDGLTWTFHLRDGLKWSDGSDLTANDFVYSWKRVCDPMVAAPYAETVLGMLQSVYCLLPHYFLRRKLSD